MKKCPKCLEEKEETQFGCKRPKWCKECIRIKFKNYYEKNPEKCIQSHIKWKEKNKEYYKKICKERYDKNRDEIRKRSNASRRTEKGRETIRRYRKKYPKEKYFAHQMVRYAIGLGLIKRPEMCEKCGKITKPDGHHYDYMKPLEVIWLCRVCHSKEHNKGK